MSEKNTGGPAFPVADPFAVECPSTDAEALRLQQGMTLRDYFAAKAMQGMLADPDTARTVQKARRKMDEAVAELAYAFADAMLKAREA